MKDISSRRLQAIEAGREKDTRASPCLNPDGDADGNADSEFSLDKRVEEDNPEALPMDPLDNTTQQYHYLRLHSEQSGRKSKLGWNKIHEMDQKIEEYGQEAQQLSW